MIVYFIRMTKKKSKLVHAQLPPPYKLRMEVVNWGQSLFTKHSILLMKSGEVKIKKQNYLDFFLRHPLNPIRRNFPGTALSGSLFIIFNLDIIIIFVVRPSSLPLAPHKYFMDLWRYILFYPH